ncbi:MAG: PilZ domain-containing protein [candidate division Zixibacteria bacterium]|nr:PilZ domain-containing protein [candidate division Zixibacteria bacterium]
MNQTVQIALPQSRQPLRVWEKVEIVIGDGNECGRYLARIEDFTEEGLIVSNPEFIEGGTRLRSSAEVRVFITRRDAVYRFYSRIKKVTIRGEQLVLLSKPRYLKRVQRRQFVRIDLLRDVTFAIIKQRREDTCRYVQPRWHDARTSNLSGGGMFVRSLQEIPKDSLLLLKSRLFLEIGLPVTVAGICRRCHLDGKVYGCGIEFIRSEYLSRFFSASESKKLPESVQFFDLTAQNKLVRFVFDHQIEMRKKGLL